MAKCNQLAHLAFKGLTLVKCYRGCPEHLNRLQWSKWKTIERVVNWRQRRGVPLHSMAPSQLASEPAEEVYSVIPDPLAV